jgi:hypothetical protein
VDAGPLDGGRQLGEAAGRERESVREEERLAGLLGREQGERDFRRVALLAAEAGPEGAVDDGLDGRGVGLGRQHAQALRARGREVAREVRLRRLGHGPRRRVCRSCHGTHNL